MSFKEHVARWFQTGMPDDFVAEVSSAREPDPAPPAPPSPSPAQEVPAVSTVDNEAEVKSLRAEVQALRARRKTEISAQANAFVEAGAGRILPAEAPFLARVYEILATADEVETTPEGGFSVKAGEKTHLFTHRSDILRHAMSLRPDLSRSQERVVSDATVSGLKVLDNGSVGSDPEADAYAQGKAYAEQSNRRRA